MKDLLYEIPRCQIESKNKIIIYFLKQWNCTNWFKHYEKNKLNNYYKKVLSFSVEAFHQINYVNILTILCKSLFVWYINIILF